MSGYQKIAKVMVAEINDINQLYSLFDMAYRFDKEIYGAFGFGCGGGCDSFGFGCGGGCLIGLPKTDEVIKARLGIDVLGKKGLTKEHLELMRSDPVRLNKAVIKELGNFLAPENIKKRMM